MSRTIRCLLIEDEQHIVNFLKLRLVSEKYEVETAFTLKDGIRLASQETFDFVILDLGLPDGDGMEFIRYTNQRDRIPIIVLSARLSESEKVEALDAGASDYVTKPFGPNELMARIRTVLRSSGAEARSLSEEAIFGELKINFRERSVTVKGEPVRLTRTEYKIFSYLARHPGKLLTYEDIIDHTWDWIDTESVKKLQVNMTNIRRKLGEVPGERVWIQNELGIGYRMQ